MPENYRALSPIQIGRKIREIRQVHGHSAGELAEALSQPDGSPVTTDMVYNWEGGRVDIRLYHLVQICNLYNLTLDYFA